MDNQWLKKQFSCNPDKSKAGLARFLGLEPPAISKILNGTRQIKAQEYNLMRRYFGLPVDGEYAATLPENAYRLDVMAGGRQDTAFSDGAGEKGLEDSSWILPADILSQRTKASAEQIKVFTVQDSLMEPELKRGEPVLVDLSDTKPSPPGTFIVSDGFGCLARFCEFVPNSKPPEVKLSAHSSAFQTQILKLKDFKILGRVIAKLHWL